MGMIGTIVAALCAPFLVSTTADVALVPVAKGFDRPVFVTPLPERVSAPTPRATSPVKTNAQNRLVVVEQSGLVRVIHADGTVRTTPFLDVKGRIATDGNEMGLLGLAFHPRFAENGFVFIAYTMKNDAGALHDVVTRFFVPPTEPLLADVASAVVVLSIPDPASNHNGGMIAFGPDGYLYVGTGDGGGAGDRYKTSRDPKSLLAKMLRIDVSTSSDALAPSYTVPKTNPFVDDARYRKEIWATGLRNPWRFSFDRATGDLYIGDVGQNLWEEVDYQPASSKGGEDYGWNVVEGDACYASPERCETRGLTPPIHVYSHDVGCSVTGGIVYRGRAIPALVGIYTFADYCSGNVWWLKPQGAAPARETGVLMATGRRISSFGEDAAGEILVVDHAGEILRVAAVDTKAKPLTK
jgi:glucose/arabinose dehydrogenase